MNKLIDRLKALGINIDSAANLPQRKIGNVPSRNFTNGKWINFHEGRLFVVEEILPYGYSHGSVILKNPVDLENLSYLQSNLANTEIKMNEIAFLDVETSSLSSGSGTLVFMVGICHLENSGIRLVQLFLDDPINEYVFINYLDHLLSRYQLLISYNGKTFDIPILKSRFIMNRVRHQLDNKAHLDLLTLSRKIWRYRLESKSLSVVEKEILIFHRGESEVPGWLVPQIYYDYLQTGDLNLLKGVFYHNKMDILSLSALFQFILLLVSNEKMIFESEGLDIFSIACLLSPHLDNEKMIYFFEKCINKGIPDEKRIIIFKKMGAYYKKYCLWNKAIAVWEINAKQSDLMSCIELAKYYEHRNKNFDKALYWVNQAERLLDINDHSAKSIIISSRKNRLMLKVTKSNG